ncbi:10928_t:CDS:2 [Funneliformis geosporum]|nr:10928_t:CDS:2 [Funneliformis geosporum]
MAKELTVTEYNKKCAIFEYLKRLDENGREKVKATSIQSPSNKSSRKSSKTIQLIDDENIAEECYSWI